MRYLALALPALLLAVVAAEAGTCATPVVAQQQVVQTPVVAQQAVAVTPVVVAQFVPVVVPAYAVGYDASTLGIVEELRAIKEELRQGREALTAPAVAPQMPPQTGGPLVLPQTAPPNPMEPLPRADASAQALAVLQKNCAACHTGKTSRGGLKIFDAPGKLAAVDRFSLWDAAEAGQMPPKPKPPVTPAELAVLRQWVREAVAKGKP